MHSLGQLLHTDGIHPNPLNFLTARKLDTWRGTTQVSDEFIKSLIFLFFYSVEGLTGYRLKAFLVAYSQEGW
ncbi:hypothetical protein EBR03_03535 [bacterium]|nr:hypothetical protein [bacterium]NBW98622.1 hypothetical protein [bacterium]NBX82196.1 hypothetical protein [bacterium]